MSKERDQRPSLSKEELEQGWVLFDRKEWHKPKVDSKCDLLQTQRTGEEIEDV
jgi:hypothetical protein